MKSACRQKLWFHLSLQCNFFSSRRSSTHHCKWQVWIAHIGVSPLEADMEVVRLTLWWVTLCSLDALPSRYSRSLAKPKWSKTTALVRDCRLQQGWLYKKLWINFKIQTVKDLCLKLIYSTDTTYNKLYVQPGPISAIRIYLLYIKTDILYQKRRNNMKQI